MNDLNPINYLKRIQLNVEKFGVQHQLDPKQLEFEGSIDYISNYLVCTLWMKVYGRELEKIEVKYPSDWKQSFKERWFPSFILKKFPVQYTVRTISAVELYPKISIKDHSHCIILKEI